LGFLLGLLYLKLYDPTFAFSDDLVLRAILDILFITTLVAIITHTAGNISLGIQTQYKLVLTKQVELGLLDHKDNDKLQRLLRSIAHMFRSTYMPAAVLTIPIHGRIFADGFVGVISLVLTFIIDWKQIAAWAKSWIAL